MDDVRIDIVMSCCVDDVRIDIVMLCCVDDVRIDIVSYVVLMMAGLI